MKGVAVISRALLRARPGEDRDIAAAIIVEVFDAPLAGDYPVLKDLDFRLSIPLFLGLARDRRRSRVLDLQPTDGATGAIRRTEAL